MPADIGESPRPAVPAAYDKDALAEELEGVEGPGGRNVVQMADDLPGRPQDLVLLRPEEPLIGIEPAGEAPVGVGIGDGGHGCGHA